MAMPQSRTRAPHRRQPRAHPHGPGSLPAVSNDPEPREPGELTHLERLIDAIVLIGSDLDLPTMLQRIIESAVDLVDATYGALGVLDPTRTALEQFITIGITDDERARIAHPPEGHGILGLLIVEPEPLRLTDLRTHPDSYGFPEGHPPMQAFLGVPIVVRGEGFGNLYLCDPRSGGAFTDRDEQLMIGLATAAGVAIEHARLHERVTMLGIVTERERIARDLHDTVIQRIFATGLSLQSIAAREQDPDLAMRLSDAVNDLDDTVRQVRTTVFELQQQRLPGRSLRREILGVVETTAVGLGFHPIVRFDGAVDIAVTGAIADEVLAVVSEALSNVVRHARATRVELDLTVTDDRIVCSLADDGVGFPTTIDSDLHDHSGPNPDGSGNGLRNVASRAQRLGGHALAGTSRLGGALLVWDVPLPIE